MDVTFVLQGQGAPQHHRKVSLATRLPSSSSTLTSTRPSSSFPRPSSSSIKRQTKRLLTESDVRYNIKPLERAQSAGSKEVKSILRTSSANQAQRAKRSIHFMDDVLTHLQQQQHVASPQIEGADRPTTSDTFASSASTLAVDIRETEEEEAAPQHRLSPVARSIESLHADVPEASPLNTDLLRTYLQEQMQAMQSFTPPAIGTHPFHSLEALSEPQRRPISEDNKTPTPKKTVAPIRHSHTHNHRPSSPTHLPLEAFVAKHQPRHQPATTVLRTMTPLHRLILHRVQSCLTDGSITEAHADLLADLLPDHPSVRPLYEEVLEVISARQLIQTAFLPNKSDTVTPPLPAKGRRSPIRLHTTALQPPPVDRTPLIEAATSDAQMMYLLTKMDLNPSPYYPPHGYTLKSLEQSRTNKRGADALKRNPLHVKSSKEQLSDPLAAPLWHDLKRDITARQTKLEQKWQHVMDYRAGHRSNHVWHF